MTNAFSKVVNMQFWKIRLIMKINIVQLLNDDILKFDDGYAIKVKLVLYSNDRRVRCGRQGGL